VIRLRQQLLPVAALGKVLALGEDGHDDGFVVIMQAGGRTFGVTVDAILQTEDIVVKPMAKALSPLRLFAGNTILGDGAVVLIIEPVRLADIIAGEAQGTEQASLETPETTGDARTTVLIFRAGDDTPKALPLSVITRLEEIDAATIEHSAGRALLQYRGDLMPIIPANDAMTLRRDGVQPLIVVSDGTRSMGLAIDTIIDIAEDRLEIADMTRPESGLIGRAIIRGRATELLDIAHFLPLAHADWLRPRRQPASAVREHVLLIEASDFLRDMLTPVLDAAGYRVTTVGDARQAVPLLAAGGFDAVLIDLDADDAAAQIALRAAAGGTSQVPFVARATFATPEQIEACRRAELGEIVTKLDRRALLAALSLSGSGTQRSAA
jgi:two-component system chemotaxis sensor kinase CheA